MYIIITNIGISIFNYMFHYVSIVIIVSYTLSLKIDPAPNDFRGTKLNESCLFSNY